MNVLFSFLFLFVFDESLFQKGNEAYQNKEYEKALEFYQQIIKNQDESAALYFNMGNCYYRLNKIGYAIFYYEKANKLSPQEDDIIANLRIANKQVVDYVEIPEQIWIFDLYNRVKYALSIDSWLLVLPLLLFISGVCFVVKKFYQQSPFIKFLTYLQLFSILFIAISTFMIYSNINDLSKQYAVLIEPNANVYTGPDDLNNAFILHEGIKFEILRELNQRFEIQLIDGKNGWIDKSFVLII